MDLTIYWDINPGAVAYIVEYKLHSASIWTSYGFTSDNHVTISDLSICQAYDFRITAQCGPASFSDPYVTSNISIPDCQCNPNAYVFAKYTNAIQPGNMVYFTEILNDMGYNSTAGMPVLAGTTYTQTLNYCFWNTSNLIVRFYTGGGAYQFHLNVYRNGVYFTTITIITGSMYVGYRDFPIVLDHPLSPGDTIEFILNF